MARTQHDTIWCQLGETPTTWVLGFGNVDFGCKEDRRTLRIAGIGNRDSHPVAENETPRLLKAGSP